MKKKYLIFSFLFIIAALISNVSASNISLITSNTSHQVSQQDLAILEGLFEKNNIQLSNFQVYEFEVRDNLLNNPEAGYYNVKAYQLYKGLPVFIENVIYGFNSSGEKVFGNERRLISNNLDISVSPLITKEDAALSIFEEYPYESNELNAELGLHNKNVGMDDEAEYVLAWKISPKGNKSFYGIVDATNREVLFFDAGVRSTNVCNKEGKMCGGIAGVECCEGLSCEGIENYPDASGICFNPKKNNNHLLFYILGGIIVILLILILVKLKKKI